MPKWTMYSDSHTGNTGVATEKLVEKLSKRPNINPNESKPVYFFGNEDEYGRGTRLSFVDIALLRDTTEKVEIFCEIEESSAPPKKIIGDIITPIFSNRMKVEGDSGRKFLKYDEKNGYLIAGLKYKTEVTCKRAKKLEAMIEERDILGKWKLKIIPKTNEEDLISAVEDEINEILNV